MKFAAEFAAASVGCAWLCYNVSYLVAVCCSVLQLDAVCVAAWPWGIASCLCQASNVQVPCLSCLCPTLAFESSLVGHDSEQFHPAFTRQCIHKHKLEIFGIHVTTDFMAFEYR